MLAVPFECRGPHKERRSLRAPAVDQCRQRVFVNETGVVIQSPGFPEGYNSSLRCEWILTTEAQNKIVLTLETVDLEGSSWCFDAIRVFDGRVFCAF